MSVWAMRVAKMGLLGAAWLTFGYIAAVIVGAILLLWLLLISEPDYL